MERKEETELTSALTKVKVKVKVSSSKKKSRAKAAVTSRNSGRKNGVNRPLRRGRSAGVMENLEEERGDEGQRRSLRLRSGSLAPALDVPPPRIPLVSESDNDEVEVEQPEEDSSNASSSPPPKSPEAAPVAIRTSRQPTRGRQARWSQLKNKDLSDTPKVMLLAMSYVSTEKALELKEMTFEDLDHDSSTTASVEQTAECVTRDVICEINARDTARCIATEQTCNVEAYTMSIDVSVYMYSDGAILL